MRKIFTFIVCILLLQTNSNAQSILWQKNLGCSNDDGANSEQQTFDGGYIIAGSTKSNDSDVTNNHGGEDFWIVKLNSSRNIGWQKTLGGSGADYEIGVQQTNDNNYIVIGNSESNDGDVTNHLAGSITILR